MSKLVTVFGATGNQGNGLVRALLKDKQYVVRAVTRQPDHAGKALAALGSQVEVVRGDLDFPKQIQSAVADSSAVFCSPYNYYFRDQELQQGKNLVNVCKQMGVPHLVFSGGDPAYAEMKKKVMPWYVKEQIEKYLDDSGVPNTKLRMSWYFENLLEWFMPAKEKEDGSFAVNIPLEGKPLHMISVSHAGRAIKSIIENPAQYIGQTIGLSAGSFTVDDVVAALNKHCKPYTFYDGQETTVDHFRRNYPEADENQHAFEYYQKGTYTRDPALTRTLDPDTPSLDAWVQEHRDQLVKKLDYEAAIPAPEDHHKDMGNNFEIKRFSPLDWKQYIY